MSVLEKGQDVLPIRDDFGELDDILGEIAGPPATKVPDPLDEVLSEVAALPNLEATDDLDSLLSEIAAPAQNGAAGNLDDILDDLVAPSKAEAAADLDSLLSEIAGPAQSEAASDLDDILNDLAAPAASGANDGFDDILSELAGPAKADPADGFDDILSELTGPTIVEEPDDDFVAMLSEIAPYHPADEVDVPIVAKEPGPRAKGGRLLRAFRPSLKGKREISRKAYLGMHGAIAALTLAVIGQAAFILTRPAHAPVKAAHAPPPIKVTIVPVDYSKVDLDRYIGKVRSLSEGGRDMLRHPRVKSAVLDLDSGEELYKDLRSLAARSPAADRMTIRDNRVTIVSCDGAVCADKSFKLVYDIRDKHAAVCVTKKYLNGSWLSYSYSREGFSEQASC